MEDVCYLKMSFKNIPDSNIIQDIEKAAKNYPEFHINWSDSYGITLLMHAVSRNREELVRYLLSAPNINVNQKSNNNHTVLHFCKQVSMFKLLLERKELDVNIQNVCGETVLHIACLRGNEEIIVELLKDERVDMSIRDNSGKTAKDKALKIGIVKILENKNNDMIRMNIRNKTIPDSEIIQNIESVKNNFGFNINQKDNDDFTLLILAVLMERKELVRYLLSIPGIDVNYRDSFNKVALHYAKDCSILKLFLGRKDLNLNIQDRHEMTILHWQYIWKCEVCIKELLSDARIDILICDDQGQMVKDIATKQKRHRIVKLLNDPVYTLLYISRGLLCMDVIQKIVKYLSYEVKW